MYHKNHSKHYYFTDKGELKFVLLSTFPFDNTFVLCKDRHLHILSFKGPNGEGEVLLSEYGRKSVHTATDSD